MYLGHHLGKPIGGGEEDFAYWRGPMVRPPEGGTEQEQRQAQSVVNEFQGALRRSFTSTNFVREIVDREVGSSTARMSWTLLEAAAKREKEDDRTGLEQEAEALAGAWWRSDRSHPERTIRAALTYARREARGVLRFRVAGGLLQVGEDGRTRVRTGLALPDIARYIRLEHLAHPEDARVWEDPNTFVPSGVYAYKDGAGKEAVEAHTVVEGMTCLRVVKEGQEEAPVVKFDLGGRILLIELSLPPLITPQVLQNQMAYNTASTMILRNTELAGFMERYGINLEPPSTMEPDPNKPGAMVRKYTKPQVGAGKMTVWRTATYDKTDTHGKYQGEEPLGGAQYGRFEPVSPEALTTAANHNRVNLYGEVGQSYVLMGADATASGRSREVAISDFDTIRQPVIDLAEIVIGEVLETFLALVAALANQAGRYKGIQVDGQVKSRVVPPSPQDRTADREDAAQGVISLLTARQRQGIDNPAQEDAQIAREREAGISPTLARQAPALPADDTEKTDTETDQEDGDA